LHGHQWAQAEGQDNREEKIASSTMHLTTGLARTNMNWS